MLYSISAAVEIDFPMLIKRMSFLLLVAITGCAGHSQYNPPSTLPPEYATAPESALIPYRTLVVDDFKATTLLAQKSPDVEGDIGAASVIIIRATPCRIHAFARSNTDSSFFEALVDSFRYEARFSQTHSWFSPAHKSTPASLLEHEQIHFAISEIAVRRANARIEEIRGRIRGRARDKMDAIHLAQQRFDEELDGVKKEASERQIQFDRETENGTHLGDSKSWAVRIRRELESTE